jgi:hypothetical protein
MSDVLTAHQRRIYVQIRAQAEAEFGLAPDAPLFVCFKEEFFPALFPTIPPGNLPPPRYTPRAHRRLWWHRQTYAVARSMATQERIISRTYERVYGWAYVVRTVPTILLTTLILRIKTIILCARMR